MGDMKPCRGGRVHDDAVVLTEYLANHGGKVAMSNADLAVTLGFTRKVGAGLVQVDMSRFVQARNHVKDRVTTGPCTGYTLHYRSSARGTEFALVDPTGSLGSHLTVVVESVRGWLVREEQHRTENRRQTIEFERLGDHALANGDRDGQRLCVKAAVEVENDGFISATTMADLNVWLTALPVNYP